MTQTKERRINYDSSLPYVNGNIHPYSTEAVHRIYSHLEEGGFPTRAIQQYEFNQLLEKSLWPNYSPATSSRSLVMLVALMVNEKVRERVPAWGTFISAPENLPHYFNQLLRLAADEEHTSHAERTALVAFLDHCFNSLEVDLVRKEVCRLTSMPIWISLSQAQLASLFEQNAKLERFWGKVERRFASLDPNGEEFAVEDLKRRFLWRLIQHFKRTVDALNDESRELDVDAVRYCERFLLLLIDLEGQLTTRRFFNSVLHASHLLTHCQLSQLIRSEMGSLFCDLVQQLQFYARFEVDDIGGGDGAAGSLALTPAQMTKRHYEMVTNLQKACFQHMPKGMTDFCLLNVGRVDTRKFLTEQLGALTAEELYPLAEYLKLVPSVEEQKEGALMENHGRYDDVAYLGEMIISHCERRVSQLQRINSQPLYPDEKFLWDEKRVPYERYDGQQVLPLNKLNLQFLTLHDYLLRNFNLFQLESTYEVRQDLEDVLFRMKPWRHESNEAEVVWGGWSRMALPIAGCRVVEVKRPRVGEHCPADVKADVQISLPKRQDMRRDWESLRRNDVLFLMKVVPTVAVGSKFDIRRPFKEQFHVAAVRGAEILGFLGPEGRVLDEIESRGVVEKMAGDSRSIRLRLDPNQYQLDAEANAETEVYFSFNLLIRRDPKTNNFKAVLATIRQLLNSECVVPEWLQDLILGYGEPDTAHYTKMNGVEPELDFNDTFLSYQHVLDSFPGEKVTCGEQVEARRLPPFKLTFNELRPQHDIADMAAKDLTIRVEPYQALHPYYPPSAPPAEARQRQNTIRFTPAQVEAIKAGMQPGLTMVVGPPGTGKTDVAVQIISNIYHNWPEQRTLIVTHSNQALNQLFEKIIELNVDERHLLRLGRGEEALETSKDFSRYGRVDYVLKERKRCLAEVQRLRDSLGEIGDVSYSCETAGYFYRYTLVRSWDQFVESWKEACNSGGTPPASFVVENFPFSRYFAPLDGSALFTGHNAQGDWVLAQRCWRYIQQLFRKLEEFMAFELLRNGRDRADYLLVKEARIIAMTCTHAALRRRDLVEMNFRYDNILMEETAQILEVETFIPLLLQEPHDGRYRLKRWIMIGDHHQLPPVVQNPAYANYANMEQSLFTRFIRLGVPFVELDAQGRARAELARLYNWRYAHLGDLPHVLELPQFQSSNPGFAHTFQFVDIPDFNGVGESTPSQFFYQNLGEAEYAVALFTYMRVLGYPAERISLLTTYNGQASLLRDIVQRRCAQNPLIGVPGRISTVDKYQGQQNDYVILSLVRTKHVGHLRDVRRLIVALSRSRLGLYILGRLVLFRSCHELQPAFERLLQHPTKLLLLPNESYGEGGRAHGHSPSTQPIEVQNTEHMGHLVHQLYSANVNFMQQRWVREHPPTKPIDETVPEEERVGTGNEGEAMEMDQTATTSEEQAATTVDDAQGPKERTEGAIRFEQVDFERLQEKPKYG